MISAQAELLRIIKEAAVGYGADLPVEHLIDRIKARRESKDSFIAVSFSDKGAAVPHTTVRRIEVSLAVNVAVDDDPTGSRREENYAALCEALGDLATFGEAANRYTDTSSALHQFRFSEATAPQLSEDEFGGAWVSSLTAEAIVQTNITEG